MAFRVHCVGNSVGNISYYTSNLTVCNADGNKFFSDADCVSLRANHGGCNLASIHPKASVTFSVCWTALWLFTVHFSKTGYERANCWYANIRHFYFLKGSRWTRIASLRTEGAVCECYLDALHQGNYVEGVGDSVRTAKLGKWMKEPLSWGWAEIKLESGGGDRNRKETTPLLASHLLHLHDRNCDVNFHISLSFSHLPSQMFCKGTLNMSSLCAFILAALEHTAAISWIILFVLVLKAVPFFFLLSLLWEDINVCPWCDTVLKDVFIPPNLVCER